MAVRGGFLDFVSFLLLVPLGGVLLLLLLLGAGGLPPHASAPVVLPRAPLGIGRRRGSIARVGVVGVVLVLGELLVELTLVIAQHEPATDLVLDVGVLVRAVDVAGVRRDVPDGG